MGKEYDMGVGRWLGEFFSFSDADVNEAGDAFDAEIFFHPIAEKYAKDFKLIFLEEFRQVWEALLKWAEPIPEDEKQQIGDFLASRGNWLSLDYLKLYGRYLGYIIGRFRFKQEPIFIEGNNFLILFEVLRKKKDDKEFAKFVKKKGLDWILNTNKSPELTNTKERKEMFERLKAAIGKL